MSARVILLHLEGHQMLSPLHGSEATAFAQAPRLVLYVRQVLLGTVVHKHVHFDCLTGY